MHKTNVKKVSMFGVAIGLLIFLHFTKILLPAENAITRFLNPVSKNFYSAGSNLRAVYNEQTDKRDLMKLAEELEEKVNELTVENAKLKSVKEENKILRNYLKFFEKRELSFLFGHIVSQGELNSDKSAGTIIINKGAKDGLEEGLGVTSSRGIIIGKIVSVKDYLSEVCLITNRSCQLAASIQNHNKTGGIVRGDLGLTIRMDFIPQTETINVGDTVVTSGLEKNIPRGLVVGEVSQISQESNELWQEAVIEPLVNMDSLTIVSVILP